MWVVTPFVVSRMKLKGPPYTTEEKTLSVIFRTTHKTSFVHHAFERRCIVGFFNLQLLWARFLALAGAGHFFHVSKKRLQL